MSRKRRLFPLAICESRVISGTEILKSYDSKKLFQPHISFYLFFFMTWKSSTNLSENKSCKFLIQLTKINFFSRNISITKVCKIFYRPCGFLLHLGNHYASLPPVSYADIARKYLKVEHLKLHFKFHKVFHSLVENLVENFY